MTLLVELPIISVNPCVQGFYERMRHAGESHNMAKMLALREAPGTRTDREFLRGHRSGNQFADDPATGNEYRRTAEAAGVSPTGKVYKSGLARFPGDPLAWVNGRGDVKRRCEQEGWSCEGAVTHKVAPRQAPSIPLAQDIVNQHADQIIAEDPGKATKRREVEAEVRQKHTPHWHKNKGET